METKCCSLMAFSIVSAVMRGLYVDCIIRSDDPKKSCCIYFNHHDLCNAMVQLMMLLVSCNPDGSTTSITRPKKVMFCLISIMIELRECYSAIDDNIGTCDTDATTNDIT